MTVSVAGEQGFWKYIFQKFIRLLRVLKLFPLKISSYIAMQTPLNDLSLSLL